MDTATASVVVGVKRLDADAAALRLAAREAAWSGYRLRVVHAFTWPVFEPAGDDRERDADAVERAAAHARTMFPGLTATGEVIDGAPVPVLLWAASRASLLVLGSSGLARHWSEPSESVSVQVAIRAGAPVLFARGTDQPGPVVVGVDGSPDAGAALTVAVGEAARRRTELIVLHANGASCVPACAAVKAEHRMVGSSPDDALIEHSRAAQLVVLGAQGDRPTLLGPVTQTVLRHAHCPVLVAHAGLVGSPARRADQRLAG
jgi:nucleotide-binding universal stress UspA family protein